MKKYIFLLYAIIIIPPVMSDAQVVGDFENFVTGGVGDCSVYYGPGTSARAPFSVPNCDGNLTWHTSHGTPEIVGGFDSPANHKRALMWAGDFDDVNDVQKYGSEGLWLDCIFEENHEYHLSFQVWTVPFTPMDEFYVYLANGLTAVTTISYDPNSSLHDIPVIADKQLVYYGSNIYTFDASLNSIPTIINVSFTPSHTFSGLWFYPKSTSFPNDLIYLDYVTFEECLPIENYSSTSSLPVMTKRQFYITAQNNVFVLNGQNVTFNAGDYIQLNPGFETNAGADFIAFIEGCIPLACNTENRASVNTEFQDSNGGIQLFPNPASETLTLEIPFAGNVSDHSISFQLADISGRTVLDQPLTSSQTNIDVKALNNGIYFYKVLQGDRLLESGKIVVAH